MKQTIKNKKAKKNRPSTQGTLSNNATLTSNTTSAGTNRTLQNDFGFMQERISAILEQENISMSVDEYFSSISSLTKSEKVTTKATPEIRYVSEGISWGVITPLALIGLFLVIVASCLYWQSWKEKRRMRDFLAQQRPLDVPGDVPYERSSEARLSIRSTESQRSRGSSTCERATTLPLRRQGSRYYPRPEEEGRWVNTVPRPLSPIDEMGRHKSVDTLITPLERSREEYLKPVSSNLQISWGTPKTSGTDSRLGVLKGYENPCFSAPGKLTGNVYCEECNAMSSPYFPNNNTPTTEYEVDSDKSVLIVKNDDTGPDIHSEGYPLQVFHHRQNPSLNCDEISSITAYPENSHPPYGAAQSSSTSVSSSGTVSLPSSISRFHASRTQNTPNYPFASTRNCSPMKLNFTLSSSIEISDHYSDNTSMFPCVGSSSTSMGTQAASRSNLRGSIYSDELQQHPVELRSKSASAPETRRPSVELIPNTKSYSVDVDCFRSFSVGADSSPGQQSQLSTSISYSMIQGVPASVPTEWDTVSTEKGTNLLDENHNVQGFDLASLPGRKVKFTVPVLDKKQYWV